MSDLPDHCKSSAPGISGSGRSGQIFTPTGYIIVSVNANSYWDFDFATSGDDTDFSIQHLYIETLSIGPQLAYLFLDIDGLGSYVQVYTWSFERVLSIEFPTSGVLYPGIVYGYRVRLYNDNYINRQASLFVVAVETPR